MDLFLSGSLSLDWKTFYEITTNFHVDGNILNHKSQTLLESQIYGNFDPFSFIVAFISIYYGGANRIREEMTTKFNHNEEEGEYFTLSYCYWPELMNTEHDCTLEIEELITRDFNFFFFVCQVVMLKKNGQDKCFIELLPRELLKSLLCCFASKKLLEKMSFANNQINNKKIIDEDNKLYYQNVKRLLCDYINLKIKTKS